MPSQTTTSHFDGARLLVVAAGLGLCLGAMEAQAQTSAAAKIDFARDIRPILAQHCVACHGFDAEARKAELRLDVLEVALAKKVIVPGDALASKLIARIESSEEHERMPPAESKKPLTDRQKQLLRTWIEQGANYSQHWAFIPPRDSAPPQINNSAWVRNPIDAFVLQRLEREKWRPAVEADKAALLRRVTLDLTGLPPSLVELQEFLADPSPDAYERTVDRLLNSPRYAERMALAWLDAARYADTNGFNNDEDRTQWPWRDWVINAFARNQPFDRFLVEQLAGDLLPGATLEQKIATGFHRNQVHNTEGGIIPEEYRVEYVADRVHTTATIFLGLSLQCARCHDHKFDPISQREYYRFFAFFNNISDKPASYANFVAAEPFVRAPSAAQQTRLAKLENELLARESGLKRVEAECGAAVAEWEKSLTSEARKSLCSVGLLLRLPLDETTGDAVLAADGGRRGVISGKPNWTTGKLAGALEFDGNTFVEISDPPQLEADRPFSISLWTYPTTLTAVALLSKIDDAAAYRGYDLLLEQGKVTLHLVHHWPDNALKVQVNKAVSLNEWHHLVATYDGSRKAAGLKIYVDGKLEPQSVLADSLQGVIQTDKPMHLGKRQSSLLYSGKLDEVQIYGIELTANQAAQLAGGQTAPLSGGLLEIPENQRTAVQQAQIRRFYLERIDKDYPRLKTELAELARQKVELEKSFPALMVMQEMPQPREAFILKRGQYDQPAERVSPGVPDVLTPLPPQAPANRLGLAEWLVQPAHPLTARVAVNRWWQMIFGVGLVKTVEDFGATGELPSHPKLLDFLATQLVRDGWNVKAMLRRLVTSATYRQSSRMTKEQLERDPENRWLARGPRQRLPAETVRDNALAISGLLKERIGGPSVKPYQPAGLWEDVTVERKGKYVAEKDDNLYRRGMYTFWKRTCPPPTMSSFDAPNRETCLARRAITNTPLQALILLNDPTFVEAARKLAERMLLEGEKTSAGRLELGFQLAVARVPNREEQRILLKIRDESLAHFRAEPAAAHQLLAVGDSPRDMGLEELELAAWTTVASTILNLDETISKR